MNSLQIKDKRAQLYNSANDIITRAKTEVRDLTDEETQTLEDYKEQIKGLDEELKKLQDRLANLRFDIDEDEENEENETPSNDEDTENNEEENKERSMKKEKFSLVRAIRSIANNQQLDSLTQAVIAKGSEEARKAGIATQGQIVLPESRAAVTVATEGVDVVATDLFDILMPLRAKNVLIQAGAKFMGGLVGDVQIPVMSANNVTWKGEVAAATDGAGTFTNVKLQPKRLTAYVDISKQMLAQNSEDVENVIRQDIINAINTKLEETILGNGDGKEGGTSIVAPIGMRNGVTAATVADFADLCDLESDVEDANVLGECVYVMSNKAKAALRGMIKGTNGTGMVYENGSVDGTKAFNTSHLGSTNTVIYGDFSNLAIGSWGGIDITIDNFTQATAGKVRIVVNAFFDAKKLRADAFAVGTINTGA
jgi:HK97 family phage major capsid protein